jgi:hypothetical protein
VLAVAAAAIAGLLGFGLAASYQLAWGLGAAAVAFTAVMIASNVLLHPDDRDPTIRPSNVPKRRG